jgi:site-specific DNA recombinase
MRATIYSRLSRDRADQESTARQEAACRDFAASRGWTVEASLTDIDRSAFRQGVRREGFEQLITTAENRGTDVILFWKLDRLVRGHADFERLWSACEANGVQLAAVMDPVDTTSEIGMMIVRMLVSFARMESVSTGMRVQAAKLASAQRGLPPSTGRRPFGLSADWSQIIPDEAEAIRWAAQAIMHGSSSYEIAQRWNADGLISPSDKPWRAATVIQCLTAPRLAARRTYRGEVVAEGQWPPILDDDTFDRLQAVLSDPKRRKGGGGPARHMLTGLIRCHCGRPMQMRPNAKKVRRYYCRAEHGGCGAGIHAERTEDLVVDALFAAIDSGDLERAMSEDIDGDSALTAIRSDESRLVQLTADYADGLMGRAEWLTARARIEARIEANRRKAGRWMPGVASLTRDEWAAHDLPWKRAALRLVFDAIVIGPTVKGGFDPTRIQPVWRV